MRALEQFSAAVASSEHDVRLDVAAFSIAACAHPALDVDVECARLDELARQCPTHTFDGLRAHCFDTLGFTGNRKDYGDPENSFLDTVIDRRVGIPITLSIAMMEIGRRLGVPIDGVGMPGHFLVGDGSVGGQWCDPFHDGTLYDVDGCRALFARVHGDASRFSPALLSPTPPRAILARMLTNLEHGRLATDPTQLAWMCELHLALPDLPPGEHKRVSAARRAVRSRWN